MSGTGPYLSDRLEETGLECRVEVHGFVPEPELDAKLAEAHLVFNLRYPTMGEASGSQLRIWNAAAAAVVTDLGWYGSLPDDTVFKIPLEGEITALQDLIRRINADRSLGAALGQAGRFRLARPPHSRALCSGHRPCGRALSRRCSPRPASPSRARNSRQGAPSHTALCGSACQTAHAISRQRVLTVPFAQRLPPSCTPPSGC